MVWRPTGACGLPPSPWRAAMKSMPWLRHTVLRFVSIVPRQNALSLVRIYEKRTLAAGATAEGREQSFVAALEISS